MSILTWDVNATDRKYSSGVDHVSIRNLTMKIGHNAWAWNGVTAINDNITGGESTKIYADNISYLNLTSDEEYGCTIESLQEPNAFAQFDGKKELVFGSDSIFNGIKAFQATQQVRNAFGLIYRTWYGDDDTPAGSNPKNCSYHFIYNCKASPASNEHATVNETPEAATHSREITTTKQSFDFTSWGMGRIKTAHIEIDCRGLSDLAFSKVVAYVEDSAMPMPDAETFKEFLDPNENIVGVEVDYENGTIERIGDAVGKNGGNDFDIYNAFGGRRRCNLADDGTITAWYGDSNYTESGENGQVMVYQPAFYYHTEPLELEPIGDGKRGYHILKANYYISDRPRKGFYRHPAFYNDDAEPIPYIFIGAYEASMFDVSENKYVNNNLEIVTIDIGEDILCSVGCSDPTDLTTGKKPISSARIPSGLGSEKYLNSHTAELMSRNHNIKVTDGWHIESVKVWNMYKLMTLIEYASFNMLESIGYGVSYVDDSGYNTYSCTALTGSTYNLGNASGVATKSINNLGTEFTEETTNGKTSVSYRGQENLWGNLHECVTGGVLGKNEAVPSWSKIHLYYTDDLRHEIDGSYSLSGCDFDCAAFPYGDVTSSLYIKYFGFATEEFDGWVFLPSMYSETLPENAIINSKVWPPISDSTSMYGMLFGGSWYTEETTGLDRAEYDATPRGHGIYIGARIMYIPNN